MTSFTYDSYGRVRTVTNPDTYALTFDYDQLDRRTRVTYPDGSYEQTTYATLDPIETRDRLGRRTRFAYDPLRRVVAITDPLGQVITQQWCACGSLDALIDAEGQKTTWERDLQGRVIQELRVEELIVRSFIYEVTTSRIAQITDARGQHTTFGYNPDDTLAQRAYPNALVATPTVLYTYDPSYRRLATMTDGVGLTTYAYHPVGTAGAGQLASVDAPLTNDLITYGYDQLGRVLSRAVQGVSTTKVYDALGRVTTETDALGTFTFGYDGVTDRVASILYPNGQTTTFAYFGVLGDHRLQTIHHQQGGTTTLSKFDYTYDVMGNLLTKQEQFGSASPVRWTYTMDPTDQLLMATKTTTDPVPVVLERYAYTYDDAGNRTSEQVDDAVVSFAYDDLNRLTTESAGGPLRVAGLVDEPAIVTIGAGVQVPSANGRFEGVVNLPGGVQLFTVTARDASGNVQAKTYQVTGGTGSQTFTYDDNGSLTSDSTRTFEWDARNQLVAVNVGTLRSEFTYDGFQRRVRIVEKDNGVVQSDTKVIWARPGSAKSVRPTARPLRRRAFTFGEQVVGVARFFTPDHLGSIGEVTTGSGSVLARYTYDAWGRRSVAAGTDVTKVGYTGHHWQATGGLWLTQYRGYDADLGRWISEDPYRDAQIVAPEVPVPGALMAALMDDDPNVDESDWSPLEESADGMQITPDGPNLYAYVRNQPTTLVDPTGQWAGIVIGAAVRAAGAIAARIAIKKLINECKKIRCKPVELHAPHHTFPWIGKACHLQLNCWRKGVKGSKFVVRIPVPCSWRGIRRSRHRDAVGSKEHQHGQRRSDSAPHD